MCPVQIGESLATFAFIGCESGLPHMTPREVEEYKALRATILQRGTTRHWVVMAGLVSWAALTLGVVSLAPLPVATFLPLLLLATTFEVVFALHTGVERVGRYLQVFYETDADAAAWEHVAMTYGRTFGGGGVDALFSPIFWAATLFNLIPAALVSPIPMEWAVIGAVHALFVLRVWVARRHSGTQRALDLDRFRQLLETRRRP
jgi:hypothetical protein